MKDQLKIEDQDKEYQNNKNNKYNNNNNYKNEENSLLVKQEKEKENLDNSRDSKRSDFSFRRLGELEISEKIKLTAFMMIAVSVLRIFSFELFVMIGELLSSIIVFLYSMWNNKCMAVLVLINGISGFVYSFISIFKNILLAKSEKFGYISVVNLIVSLFSTLVYAIVIYLAHYGFKHFELLRFGKHEDRNINKEKNGNDTSQYGTLEKDLNNSFIKAEKNANKNNYKNNKENNDNKGNGKEDIFDNLNSLGEKAKETGENISKLKNGIDMVGDALNKLGKK